MSIYDKIHDKAFNNELEKISSGSEEAGVFRKAPDSLTMALLGGGALGMIGGAAMPRNRALAVAGPTLLVSAIGNHILQNKIRNQ